MNLGKYELISRLAVGGMAEVFLARAMGPMGFEKTLVLKRILPHLAEDPTFVEMFLAEAKLAAQLNHPNIVQIFDFGEAEGDYFLAMEHIDGLNLRVLLKRARALGKSLPPELCARLIACACEGLGFAHDFQAPATGEPLRLVHRDVSTDNILVSHQGAVKVVDFGIAKAANQGHKTHTGVVKGKLAYMPPEQIRAMPLDRRADVYALGVVFYELLTGHKPFNAASDASLMQAILFEPQVPAVQHRPDLPAPLQHILKRALAKDREERYPNCRAFQTELEDFILSTGKSVGAYQLAQFVTQLMSLTDTGPYATKDSEERSALLTEKVPASATNPVTPRSKRKWLPGSMGTVLLIAGGGYILADATLGWGRAVPPTPLSSAVEAAAASQASPLVPASTEDLQVPPALAAPLTAGETLTPPSQAIAEQEAPPVDGTNSQMARLGDHRRSSRTASTSVSRGKRDEARKPGASQVGKLHLVVRGWADIWVDGQKMGRVPPINELELPAGRHEVQLINPAVRPYRAIVTITAGKTLEHSVVFQAAAFPKAEPRAERPALRETKAAELTAGAR